MNRFFCFCLWLVLAFVFVLPCSALADEKERAEAQVYESFELTEDGTFVPSDEVLFEGSVYAAVDYMNLKKLAGVVVLSESVKLTRGLTLQSVGDTTSSIIIDGNVQLDLNGHFITQLAGGKKSENPLLIVPKESKLTLNDTFDGQKGVINGVCCAVDVNGGDFELIDGIVMAQSQASLYYDENEIAVKVRNHGKMTMTGGLLEYSGALEDGRVYSDESSALSVGLDGSLEITGGVVDGNIQTMNKGNVTISGGKFIHDVFAYVGSDKTVEEENGFFVVSDVFSEISAVMDGAATSFVVKSIENDDMITVDFSKTALEVPQYKNLKMDCTGFFESLRKNYKEKCPDIEVNTGMINLAFSGADFGEFLIDTEEEKVFLEIHTLNKVDDDILSKVSNAKAEFKYVFTDSHGRLFDYKIPSDAEVFYPHFVVKNQSIQVYSVDGENVRKKNSEYDGEYIYTSVDECERIVVATGIVIDITGKTLDIQGTISMVFYADIHGVDVSKVRMLFWEEPQSEYTVESATRIVSYDSKDSNGYRFMYEDIASKEMSKRIYARLVVEDQNGKLIYGDEPQSGYSIMQYAENMMHNSKMKPLLIKMLNYGAAAQEYFETNDEPANSILSDVEKVTDFTKIYRSDAKEIQEPSVNGECSANIAGKTLTLEGDISINYYVNCDEDVDEIGMIFWYEESFEDAEKHIMGTQSKRISDFEVNGNYKVFSFDNIVSSGMSEPIYSRVYTIKDNVYKYGIIDKYSVKDYAAKQIEKNENPALIKLLRCLLLYGEEAEKYFNAKSL